MSERKLLLVDAHALIHRSYHAIEREVDFAYRRADKGSIRFCKHAFKGDKRTAAGYDIAAAFDQGKSIRVEQFAEYKANRPSTPDDLRSQFKRCREFCAVLGIPVFAKEGFEADDLIGTLSLQSESQKLDTVILTGDRDTLQLVDDHTNVLMFIGYTGEIKLYDSAAVQERFGFGPKQLN